MADAGVTGNTQLSATKQEVISEIVQRELISQGVLAPTILDVSRFAVKGASTISFPKATSFTAENRATAAAATKQALTFDKDTLTLDKRATVLYLIDAMDELESVVDVRAEYAKRAAAAHALYLEQQIIAKMSSVAYALTDATGDISDAAILAMRKTLFKHKAKMNNLALAISPDQEAVMLGIEKFVSAFQYGQSNIPNGMIGKVYGVPVFISTELAQQEYYMYDKEGIALGFQRGPQMDERPAPEYGAGSKLTVIDQKFGLQGLQLAQQSMSAGISALVVSDNN
jgi:hypothetical protein